MYDYYIHISSYIKESQRRENPPWEKCRWRCLWLSLSLFFRPPLFWPLFPALLIFAISLCFLVWMMSSYTLLQYSIKNKKISSWVFFLLSVVLHIYSTIWCLTICFYSFAYTLFFKYTYLLECELIRISMNIQWTYCDCIWHTNFTVTTKIFQLIILIE